MPLLHNHTCIPPIQKFSILVVKDLPKRFAFFSDTSSYGRYKTNLQKSQAIQVGVLQTALSQSSLFLTAFRGTLFLLIWSNSVEDILSNMFINFCCFQIHLKKNILRKTKTIQTSGFNWIRYQGSSQWNSRNQMLIKNICVQTWRHVTDLFLCVGTFVTCVSKRISPYGILVLSPSPIPWGIMSSVLPHYKVFDNPQRWPKCGEMYFYCDNNSHTAPILTLKFSENKH